MANYMAPQQGGVPIKVQPGTGQFEPAPLPIRTMSQLKSEMPQSQSQTLQSGKRACENEVMNSQTAGHSITPSTPQGQAPSEAVPVEAAAAVEDEPVIDITINNVVCSFNTRCHLNLKRIALEGMNVIFKRENGMVSMKLRNPSATASIWSSGKITCTGSSSEVGAKKAGRRIARNLQKMGFRVRFCNFRVVNVLGTCALPFGIRLNQFSRDNAQQASYEPELHPGVTYRIKEPKATLKVFSTGSVTVTAPCVNNVQSAIEHIYPIVHEYRMPKAQIRREVIANVPLHLMPHKRRKVYHANFDSNDEDEELWSDVSGSEDGFNSESSQD